jgi:sugar-specific transcriptional regulator TrmB
MARCYASLITTEPQTGYAVAKATGVPQPKVYETLRKLVARGAAHQLAGEPARYVAIPREELFDALKSSFDERLRDARESSENLVPADAVGLVPVDSLLGRDAVLDGAAALLASASGRIRLSAGPPELEALAPNTVAAAQRGAEVQVLACAETTLERPGIQVFQRTAKQSRIAGHVALVADEQEALYAIAPDGATWEGMRTRSAAIVAAITENVQNGIELQRLVAASGPSSADPTTTSRRPARSR